MRRAVLVAIVLAGLSVVPIIWMSLATSSLKSYHGRVRDLAFCEKGFEIASSFPSYASRNFADEHKNEFLEQADLLTIRQIAITNILETSMREEGIKLGVHASMFSSMLDEYRTAAELKAVHLFASTETPSQALDHLTKICDKYIK